MKEKTRENTNIIVEILKGKLSFEELDRLATAVSYDTSELHYLLSSNTPIREQRNIAEREFQQ